MNPGEVSGSLSSVDRQRLLCVGWASFTGVVRLCGLLVLLAFPAYSQEGRCAFDFPHDSNPTKVTDADICNFHQVDPELYRGGRPRPGAYPKLLEIGIRTIIDLEETEHAERERATVEELNRNLQPEERIDFISFPIDQTETERAGVSEQRLRDLFQQMQRARRPIFVHCYLGKDRTGAVVALYRMRRHQKSYQEAYDEAYHYMLAPEGLGLTRTIDRYESVKKLDSLPRP